MKLYQLGKQIRDLSNNSASVYHGIYHVDHHTNSNDTAEVKKEKNKIASRFEIKKNKHLFLFLNIYCSFRACRLRKKAQHEANKLKLHGLNDEHSKSSNVFSFLFSKKQKKHDLHTVLAASFAIYIL